MRRELREMSWTSQVEYWALRVDYCRLYMMSAATPNADEGVKCKLT